MAGRNYFLQTINKRLSNHAGTNSMEGMAHKGKKGSRTAMTIHGYVPGGPVTLENASSGKKRARTNGEEEKQTKLKGYFPHFPPDLLEKMIDPLVEGRVPMSVIMLSMVNKQCHQAISGNLEVWHKLYKQWRGPIRMTETGPVRTAMGGGTVNLFPTVPRSLPNFRDHGVTLM